MTHADTASTLVLGDRNTDYGSPDADFAGVALMWSGLLNTKLKERITKEDVALMMVALKLRRQAHKPKDDNLVDAHGYLICAEWINRGAKPAPLAHKLEQQLLAANETIEAVATGARLTCQTCGNQLPCDCEHRKP